MFQQVIERVVESMAGLPTKDELLEVRANAIGVPSHFLEQVGVDLEGDGDVGMAEAVGDLLWLDTGQDKNACVIVTAIMT